jgi:recombination protein RecR
MNLFSKDIQALLQLVRKIPYLQNKHVYHTTEELLSLPTEDIQIFLKEIIAIKENIERCSSCFSWKEKKSLCYWCSKERNQTVLCVVETWIDAVSIERANLFEGVFHILGGKISPIKGIGPDQLTFNLLAKRLSSLPLEEVIIATNQTPQGEITASYVERFVCDSNKDIVISYLASGIPVGAALEYVDRLTIQKALSYRRRVSR